MSTQSFGHWHGNLVRGLEAGYGSLSWKDGVLTEVSLEGEVRPGADWLVPGFLDTHLHGLGLGEPLGEGIGEMAKFGPHTGLAGFCPTLSSITREIEDAYLEQTRVYASLGAKDACSRILGAHLEGPFLDETWGGGMNRAMLRKPNADEVQHWLELAQGTLRLVTIAPELPGAGEVIRLLVQAGVTVSAGHTGMTPEQLPAALDAGISRICHLFDAYPGREVLHGVSQVSITDAVLIEPALDIELIVDGFHVPPPLIRLAARAAGVNRLIAITDSMQGAGLPDAIYHEPDGREYQLTNGGVCRLTDESHGIVGSCLTMNYAFFNLVTKFGFTPVEASQMTAANPARSIGLGSKTGALLPGRWADVTVLAEDFLTVKRTLIGGNIAYEA